MVTAVQPEQEFFLWHKPFRDGRESIEDDELSGAPCTTRTVESIEKVRDFIAHDPNTPIRLIAESLQMSYGTVQKILAQDLNKKIQYHRRK